jgi:methyltransferase (TIGR00027 family)
MCAASRYEESQRPDSIFEDPLGHTLAGSEGLRQPMGAWILVPRTRYGDDFLVRKYYEGCRQLVLLGAGMDSRAFRTFSATPKSSPAQRQLSLPELRVFEVDQQTTFDVKEPLLTNAQLKVQSRHVVGTDFSEESRWVEDLLNNGFDCSVPTVWLLEGLLYYLKDHDVQQVMYDIGRMSANGSGVFHDSISRHYVRAGIAPAGAPFVSGSDDYGKLWQEMAGFNKSFVRDFGSIRVDRRSRSLLLDQRDAEARPEICRGRDLVLFVEAEKVH